MTESKIELKPIKDLLGMNFFIPDYQRGYRWEKQQTEDLLEDIWSFASKENKAQSEIYCIQPLVVQAKKEEIIDKIKKEVNANQPSLEKIKRMLKGSWNVVDGQQRLTTIFLILKYLGEKNTYTIDYETREKSKDFLENI